LQPSFETLVLKKSTTIPWFETPTTPTMREHFRTLLRIQKRSASVPVSEKFFWGLLYIATVNRVRQHYRDLTALKRCHTSSSLAINALSLKDLQTPFAEAQMADLLEFLLSRLDLEDPTHLLRKIALLYLDDHSASSIAKLLHKRKTNILISLRLIRSIWQEHQEA
jgi:hypothetical protein